MATLGFVGLGAMGSRMAMNLVRAGHRVQAYNRSPAPVAVLAAAGAQACATPAEAARGAQAVVVVVADDDASSTVITAGNGVLAGAQPGAVVVDCTTATPAHSRAVAAEAAARGVRFVDAPILGSLPQAENRELVFVAGGDAAAFADSQPVLAAMGRLVRHVGPSGAGATLKLLNNIVSATLTEVLAEIALVGERAGVDAGAMVEILNEGAAGSRLTKTKLPKMLKRDFVPQFRLALMEKDVRYFLALAEESGRPVPVAATVAKIYRSANDAGLGAMDTAAVFRWLAGDRPTAGG
jgi:3-hydroxyisobutyrate dehydrogenase-like beta-hydroxyacid dehydrogenase